MEGKLRFRLLTPAGEAYSGPCDDVELTAKDDAAGNGGGSLGIRRGHIPAVVALEEGGRVRVLLEGETVFAAHVRGGFARIDRESVTVLTAEIVEH
jgi:F0F1-type ATP synthase epsilon subunit